MSERIDEKHIVAIRLGHGANCSSVGSVIDTLFATATVGGAILAAVAAAMSQEPVREVPASPAPRESPASPASAAPPPSSPSIDETE